MLDMSVAPWPATAAGSVAVPARPYRLFGGFRLLLALLVAVQHFGASLTPPAVRELLAPLAPGNVAVMVFFVMSGFIIFEARAAFYRDRPGAFLLNRGLRIVPPFIAAVGLSILVHYALGDHDHAGVYSAANVIANLLGFLPGANAIAGDTVLEFFGYAWSIRVELLFYLLVFGAMSAETVLRRFLPMLPDSLPMRLLCSLALLLFLVWRLGLPVPAQSYVQYAPYFVFGAALYSSHQGSRGAMMLCLAMVPMMFWHLHDYEDMWFRDGRNVPFQQGLLALLLMTIAILPMLRPTRALARPDSRLGDLSYAFYLNHPLAGAATAFWFASRTDWAILFALPAGLILSMLMFRAIEPALGRIRNLIRGTAIGN